MLYEHLLIYYITRNIPSGKTCYLLFMFGENAQLYRLNVKVTVRMYRVCSAA